MNQILEFSFVRCLNALKSRWPIVAIHINAIQAQNVKVDVEVESAPETLYERYCSGRTLLELKSRFVDQMGRDRPINDAQHIAHRLGWAANR